MKKILMSLGPVAVMVAPIMAAVSCGEGKDNNNNSQMTVVNPKTADDIMEVFDAGVSSSWTAAQIYNSLSQDGNKWTPLPFLFTNFEEFTSVWGIKAGEGKEKLEEFGAISNKLHEETGNDKDFLSLTIIEIDPYTGIDQDEVTGKFQFDHVLAENRFEAHTMEFDFSIKTTEPSPMEHYLYDIQQVFSGGTYVTNATDDEIQVDFIDGNHNDAGTISGFDKIGFAQALDVVDIPEGYKGRDFYIAFGDPVQGIHGYSLPIALWVYLHDESITDVDNPGNEWELVFGDENTGAAISIQTNDYQPLS